MRAQDLNEDELALLADCQLITAKPMMFVCNVMEDQLDGNDYTAAVGAHAAATGAKHIIISGKIESELMMLDEEERDMFMADLGMTEPGLNALVKAGYDLLDLQVYFTAGEKEVRAWRISKGYKAPQAAGVIHTDFEGGFIRAEVCAFDDYIAHNGEKGCRDAGKLRAEGKDYVVQDGDVMHFLTN